MNGTPTSETPPSTPAPPPTAPAATTPVRRSGRGVLLLAALALIATLALGAYVWRLGEALDLTRAEAARRLGETEAAVREVQAVVKQNREALDALLARAAVLEAQLAEMQSQQVALQAIYQDISRGRDDRLLAEVEQDVTIAAQQLQLAGNVEAALIALGQAEARLAKNAQPQFLPLRKLIARDLERLKALPYADVGGIAIKLDMLIEAVSDLPLAFEQRPAAVPPAAEGLATAAAGDAPSNMVKRWLAEVWYELRQLVRIERIDRPDPGLLSPRESFFLRENLRLRLLAARLALLARDGRAFARDLGQAEAWLERYFDTRAPAVAAALADLRALRRLDLARTATDLDETLAALRNLKLAREKR